MQRTSEWSKDGRRRFRLGRVWKPSAPRATVVGFNPSRADSMQDDPTNRRLINLLEQQGFGGYCLVNLIPTATPYPRELRSVGLRLSAKNRAVIQSSVSASDALIVAWGVDGVRCPFRHEISRMGKPPLCFGTTQGGEPRHPLYLPRTAALVEYQPMRPSALDNSVLNAS